jgi:acyl-CoA reductase-like NAD-dependent aldehyde dehydrogenase
MAEERYRDQGDGTFTDPSLYRMFVGGEYVSSASDKVFEVENPATGEIVALVSEGDGEDIDYAVEVARQVYIAWGRTSGEERGDILSHAARLLAERLEELIRVEVSQTGRAYREMSAQLARLPEWYSYFGAVARTHEDTAPPVGNDYLNYTRRVPLGVVGAITPWNHPLLILTKKVAPALAAGNAIVAKPSELAPLTALMLGEVLREAGIPDGVFNVVPGFGATAGLALSSHPGLRKLDLTGGTETGKSAASLAGKNLAQVGAELGGKASTLFFEDVDIEAAVNGALFASFVAAGQTCIQGARALVHRSLYNEFIERLVRRADRIVIGDPQDSATQMGPLVSEKQLQRVEWYVQLGIEEGATLAAGGHRIVEPPYDKGYFYLPTIFTDVDNEMRIAQEEIFGPVVCVMPFDTEEQAVELANGTEFGLAGAVWTKDVRRAHRVAHRLEMGVVWINDHHRTDPASPWGGFKMSGIGRENGLVAYEGYTQVQNILVNLSDEPFDWFGDDSSGKRLN